MANIPRSVSNWQPAMPTKTNQSLMQPNAKDNPDSLTPTNKLVQAEGKSSKPSGMFGKRGKQA